MTVGFELAKLTGLKLFHNHLTIDLVLNFFDFGEPQFHQLVAEFRRRIFEEVAASNLSSLIFTFVWAFDLESDTEYIEKICAVFREKSADIYFVELEASLAERLKRNETEFRLAQKIPKRDVEKSKANLLASEKHQLNSGDRDFFRDKNYLRINNTNLIAEEAAQSVVEKFGFSKDNF
ncbi:MAG: shikimate kinase [Pyrinomonadaceae bacterium]